MLEYVLIFIHSNSNYYYFFDKPNSNYYKTYTISYQLSSDESEILMNII
jgi:hypothetical protein